MNLRTMALATLCALAVIAPALAIESTSDPTPRISIYVHGGFRDKKTVVNPVSSKKSEVAAQELVTKVMRENAMVKRTVNEALRWLDRYHESAPRGRRALVSETGRLKLVLNMEKTFMDFDAFASIREFANAAQPGVFEAMVQTGAGGLVGLPAESTKAIEARVADILIHEFDHISLMLAEGDYATRYPNEPRADLLKAPGLGKAHTAFTVSDSRTALVEGMAEARQLFSFMSMDPAPAEGPLSLRATDSYLYSSFRKRMWTQPIWSGFIEPLPTHTRILVELARAVRSVSGALGIGLGFEGPVPKLKSLSDMQATEGVVALVLYDLESQYQISAEQVHEVHSKPPPTTTLLQLVERLIALAEPQGVSPVRIRKIVSRRLLGMNLDEGRAKELYRRLSLDELTPDQYVKEVERLVEETGGKDTLLLAEVGAPKEARESRGKSGRTANATEPAERLRARLGKAWNSHLVQGQVMFAKAFVLSNWLIALAGVEGSKNPVESFRESVRKMKSPEFLKSTAVFLSANAAAEGILQAGASKLGSTALGPNILKAVEMNSRLGGPLGMLAASILTRNLLSNEFSFWDCKGSGPERVASWMVRVFWVTGWETKAKLELLAGTAGFAAVMWYAGAAATGPFALGVLTVALVASHVSGLVVGVVYDAVKNKTTMDGIQKALAEYKAAGTPVEKKAELAMSLGTVEPTTAVVQLPCSSEKKDDKTKVITKGLFKDFVDMRNAQLGQAQAKLDEFVNETSKPLDESAKKFAEAQNPLHGGVDVEKATLLWAYDEERNDVSPAEITEKIMIGCLSDPELNKQVGGVTLDKPETVNALAKTYHAQVAQTLGALERAERLARHDALSSQFRDEVRAAEIAYKDAERNWARGVSEKAELHLDALRTSIGDEIGELKTFELEPIAEHNRELVTWLNQRRVALARTFGAYREIVQEMKTADAPPRPE